MNRIVSLSSDIYFSKHPGHHLWRWTSHWADTCFAKLPHLHSIFRVVRALASRFTLRAQGAQGGSGVGNLQKGMIIRVRALHVSFATAQSRKKPPVCLVTHSYQKLFGDGMPQMVLASCSCAKKHTYNIARWQSLESNLLWEHQRQDPLQRFSICPLDCHRYFTFSWLIFHFSLTLLSWHDRVARSLAA